MIELVRATRVRRVYHGKKIVIKINSRFYLQNKNINHLILKIQRFTLIKIDINFKNFDNYIMKG